MYFITPQPIRVAYVLSPCHSPRHCIDMSQYMRELCGAQEYSKEHCVGLGFLSDRVPCHRSSSVGRIDPFASILPSCHLAILSVRTGHVLLCLPSSLPYSSRDVETTSSGSSPPHPTPTPQQGASQTSGDRC
jgi:hypothetical protein